MGKVLESWRRHALRNAARIGREGHHPFPGALSRPGRRPLFIDGELKPSIQGTGTEDYFLMAWGLAEGLYPYFGCTHLSPDTESPGVEYCLYRWHVADPVRFSISLRFAIEHTGWISADETESGKIEGHVEREDDIATVAFRYQAGQPRRLAKLPPLAERRFPNLDITLEGRSLAALARHSAGTFGVQKGYDWTGEGQAFFMPASDRPVLEVDF